MDYSALDDKTLIRLIAHAKTEALSELYDRYSHLVFSVALAVISNHTLAEEVTQDVFLRVWESAGTYKEGQAKVNIWLSRIARNRAIDVLRRHSRHPEQHITNWAEWTPPELSSHDSPQKIAELTIQKERIRTAIAQLPQEQQNVLHLVYFQGYTQREIAKQLNEPLGTIKTRVRLAMLKLRNLLHDE